MTNYFALTVLLFALVASVSANGQLSPESSDGLKAVDEVVVFGRASEYIGQASSSSEGNVGGADLAIRPLLQVAELLEVVPGMIAVQHSGSGKANQYFLRGFNLDHGTDFTNSIDGMPYNFRSHGHGQGYLDVNGLIPETIDRIDFRKGTYRADSGDFSMAGASFMHTIDKFERSFVSLETGSYDWRRLAAGGSTAVGNGTLSGIGQFKTYDGPWELGEDLDHKSIWAKYVLPTFDGSIKATLSGYDASWKPTEQIPESAIGTAVCEDEFCTLDPTARGSTDRWIATLEVEHGVWDGSLYAQYYDWEMSSNPTYDEQINQFDRRWTLGGRLTGNFELSDALSVVAGIESRYDDIGRIGVDYYHDGEFLAPNGNNEIREGSVAAFAELDWTITDKLRLRPGVRADYYYFDVTALNALSSDGTDSDALLSPKLAIAYRLAGDIEAYANWGFGFHSNDARGVVDETSPVDGLVHGDGYEVGGRFETSQLKLSLTYWWLNIDSELSFVGDSNSVEPKGGSSRQGVELVGFWQPAQWLAIDGVFAHSKARFIDPAAEGGRFVDGAIETAGQFGITINHGSWDVSSRLRYMGAYALLPDNSERADAVTTLNLRAARTFGAFSVYGEIINLSDANGKDIVYFYQTDVPGLGPTEGRVSRAMEPRTYRLGIKFSF